MFSNGKPGGPTALGKVVVSVIIAAIAAAVLVFIAKRPKAPVSQDGAQVVMQPAPQAPASLPKAEERRADPAPAPVQQATPQQPGGSEDPYANLSTKEKK